MTKTILVSLAVLTLSASSALAAHRYHHHPVNAYAAEPAPPSGVNSSDHEMYLRNLRDAGYNPKNDYDANGILKTN